MAFRIARPVGTLAVGAGLLLSAALAPALESAASASFRTDRVNLNSGGDVQASGGGSFRVVPHVIGGPVVGHSTSATFRLNHGRVGGQLRGGDDVWVDPFWLSQADVDADPTVGTSGCNPPALPLTFGVNAFQDLASAVTAVNPGGRVRVMNSGLQAENVAIAKSLQLLGEDESIGACTGLDGRSGATIFPATGVSAGKAILNIQSGDVTIRDLTIDGNQPFIAGPSDADFAIRAADGTGTFDNLTVRNVAIRSFRNHGIYLELPNTSGHVIEDTDVQLTGDYLANGLAAGGGILLGGASGTITDGSVTQSTTGISVYGGGAGTLAGLVGSNALPIVTVQGTSFSAIGGGALGNGEGAIAYLADASGAIDGTTIASAHRGVRVGAKASTDTLTISNNVLNGPMQVGMDVHDIYAAPAAVVASSVAISSNTLQGTYESAGIAVRFVGQDAAGTPRNAGVVTLANNELLDLSGAAGSPVGVFLHGIDPAEGAVALSDNIVDGLLGGNVASGILIDTLDSVFTSGIELASANIAIDGGVVSDWATGIRAENTGTAGAATIAASVGTNAGNLIARSATGVLVGEDATLDIGDVSASAQTIEDNDTGVSVQGATAVAVLANNVIRANQAAGLAVSGGATASAAGNSLETAGAAGSVGVRAGLGGGTIDLGGGVLGSAGGNIFNVTDTNDNWAVALDAAGTYRAENNTWQYQGATYNGAVAIDDLIKDGDADNPVAEGATAGPLDFIPFQQETLEVAVTLDANFARGTDAGYGVTQFRALSDALEAVASSGVVTAEDGDYLALRYNADALYAVPGLTITRPVTVSAANPGGAAVYPPASSTGTNIATIREAGTITLLEIAASNVAFVGLVLDGDNPSVGGGFPWLGADINARNGVVIDAAAAPDGVALDQLTVRNFYFRGIATDTSGGGVTQNVAVSNSLLQNIDAFINAAAASTAIELEDVRSSAVSGNTVSQVRRGVLVRPNDNATTHLLANNTVTTSDLAIEMRGIAGASRADVIGNTILATTTGASIQDVSTGGSVFVTGNSLTSPQSAMNVLSVDSASLVSLDGNQFNGTGVGTGVRTYATARSGTGTGVELTDNDVVNYATGVMIDSAFPLLPAAANTGTALARNRLNDNDTAVQISDTGGATTYALVGGADATARNFLTSNIIGISVAGASAQADIQNNGETPTPPWIPVIDGHTVGVDVSGGAVARIVNNRFDNSSLAAIRVSGAGTEALIERNVLMNSNQEGIRIQNDALASMGPGLAATKISDPFFGGAASVGLNKLRGYGGLGDFAIHNTSAFDQDAENNDFGTTNLLAIEFVVEHQPDNGQGRVFYDPPSSQFTQVDDWSALQQ